MAVNFCCHNLKTEVNTVAVSCEGYELSNLLSCDPLQREKGFLAEGFTKPPISIFFKFFCNVDISHIFIWTEVGRQKSNGVELLITPGFQRHIEKNYHGNSSQMSCQGAVRIGSCKLNNESGLAFKKFNPHDSPVIPLNLLIRDVNTFSANTMKCARSLEVKIFSTSNSSVPALKKIEVWGRPSRSCPENIKKLIYELWNHTHSDIKLRDKPIKNIPAADKNFQNTENKCKVDHLGLLCRDNPEIPDEFLDPITCNIMAIPMALPSGKVVDITTLDKFNAAESLWGRVPSDPFTGIPFTSTVYAVPDSALKSRIDQFLLEHGHLEQYKGVGRTVGQGSEHHSNLLNIFKNEDGATSVDTSSNNSSSSSLKCVGPSSSQASSSKTPEEVPIKVSPFHLVDENLANVRSQLETVNNDFSDGNISSSGNGIKRKNMHSSKPSPSVLCKKSRNTPITFNHEDILEDSLDFALESVLTGLPSYVKTPVASNDSQQKYSQESGCGNCNSMQCLFSLPCKHLICRSCLVKTSSGKCLSLKCFVCNHSFSTGDVKRFHIL